MKKIVLILSGCMLFASLSFAQQDTTLRKSDKKHKSTMSPNGDTTKKDTSKKRSDKKGKSGMKNNMDSTATMAK